MKISLIKIHISNSQIEIQRENSIKMKKNGRQIIITIQAIFLQLFTRNNGKIISIKNNENPLDILMLIA